MKLTIIGASGSFPGPGSPASCYLLTAEGVAADGVTPRTWRILLDLGNGALGVLQRYVELEDLDGILLSHLHPDHFMDLCGMHVAIRWNPAGWGRGRLPVYGPACTADRVAEEPDAVEVGEFELPLVGARGAGGEEEREQGGRRDEPAGECGHRGWHREGDGERPTDRAVG